MANLKITLACWNYDRTRALTDGSVASEGVDLTYRDGVRRRDSSNAWSATANSTFPSWD